MNRKKETKNPLREALNSLKEISLDDEIKLESGKSVGTSDRPVKKLSEERINTKTGETLKPKRSSKHYDENTTFEQWFDKEYAGAYDDDVEDKFYPFSNYIKVFPNAKSLKDATAKDIIAHAHEFYDVYDVDSADREKAFEFACDVTGRKYDDFFNAWLSETPLAESKGLRKSGLKEGTTERYINTLKDEWGEMLERGKEPIIEFDNGDYYYIEPDWENKKFYAGHASNAGIMREIEIPMDPDMNLDEHIAELFDAIVDLDPSLLVDDDWNDPDSGVEFINIGEDIDTDSGEKSLKESDASDFSLVKNNAIKAAKRDGYDQIVTLDDDGDYTIHRDYPGTKFDGKIVGRTKTSWDRGVQNVRFIDESLKEGFPKTVDVNTAREALDTIEFYLFGDIGYLDYDEREELDSDAKSAYRKLEKFIDGVEKYYIKGDK